MSSTPYDSEARAWACSLGARLRLIQSGFEQDEPGTRQGFLSEEIERAIKPLPPSRRQACLEALEDQFPSWQSAAPESEPRQAPSLDDLVRALREKGPLLSDEERHDIARELASGQVIPEASLPPAIDDEFWKRFGRRGAGAPDPERTLRLMAGLSDFFMALDQLAWTLWRNKGVKSAYAKESDFAKIAGPYLAGESEVSTEQIRLTIERTRKLIAALLGAPSRAAADFAAAHDQTFSPDAIEAAARQGKRALESLEAASWREYKERFKAQGTQPQIENAIQLAAGQAAEDLIGGRAR